MLKMVMVICTPFSAINIILGAFLNGGETIIEGKVTSKGVGLKNNLGLKRN